MRERRSEQERRRAREFERFVAGAAGRLLHTATLLTCEPAGRPAPAAEELLLRALSRTYADWDRLRGDDPYAHTRRALAALPRALRERGGALVAHTARRHRRPRGGLLDRLSPQERLVLVLRFYEDVAEEQTAAQLGLPAERVHALCLHALGEMRSRRPGPAPCPEADCAPAPGTTPEPTAMSPPDRKETEVRRMLAGPHPLVPADLAARATARGRRLMIHRRRARHLGRLLALLVLAALVWAAATQPWLPPPAHTTPRVEGW